MKYSLPLFACISALTLTPVVQAEADFKVYGRVLYNVISDDTEDDIYFGRHEFAESTFGFKGHYQYENLEVGAQIELGLFEGVAGLTNSRNRIQEIYVKGDFGTIKLGTGTAATFVIGDVDQSGTFLPDPLGPLSRFGATRRGPAGQSQTPLVGSENIFNERLQYISPKFFESTTLIGQINESGGYEVGIKLLKNGWRATAWTVDNGDGVGVGSSEKSFGALAGYIHSSGVNFNVSIGQADKIDGSSGEYMNLKLGYKKGKHAVSISNGNYETESADGLSLPDHTRNTLSYVYSLTGGVQVWLQGTQGDTDGEESFNAFALGGMVKF